MTDNWRVTVEPDACIGSGICIVIGGCNVVCGLELGGFSADFTSRAVHGNFVLARDR